MDCQEARLGRKTSPEPVSEILEINDGDVEQSGRDVGGLYLGSRFHINKWLFVCMG